MRVRRLDEAGVFVLDVDEEMNEFDDAAAMATLDEIDRALEKLHEHVRLLILDCARLAQVNSAGVGNMLRLKSRVVQRGGAMRLAALQPEVKDVMEVVHGELVFDVFDSVEEAAERE